MPGTARRERSRPRMRKVRIMTHEEREFAEQHHGMVAGFLRRKRLPEEDFYDVAVFGYLSAVQLYVRDPPAGVPFEALAIRAMMDALHQDREYNVRAKRNGYAISWENMRGGLPETIEDPKQDVHRQAERRDLLERAMKAATPNEMPIIRLLIGGYGLTEAARTLGLSKGAACMRMHRFYERARDAIC